MADVRPRGLFISYNGLLEPLGSSQIVPYLRGLARAYRMSVLSFEKGSQRSVEDAEATARLDRSLAEAGIEWIQLRYHKRPSLPATLYDILHGLRRAARLHARQPIDLVHARGYVPAAIAWGLKRASRVPYLFDIRGLQAEESVDAGHWSPRSLRYRLTKWMEQRLLRDADGLVTLAAAIRPHMEQLPGLRGRATIPPWEVIPSCADLEHFRFRPDGRRRVRAALGVGERPLWIYAGSIGTWYLLEEMLDCFRVARSEWAGLGLLLVINAPVEPVRAAVRRAGLSQEDVFVRRARFEEMPDYLSAAEAGIAFIRPCVSKRSSSPTKFAEYLACGLPLLINWGIGDGDDLIAAQGAGALVRSFEAAEYRRAAVALRELVARGREPFRQIAEQHFSVVSRALPAYRRLYQRILGGASALDAFPTPGAVNHQRVNEPVTI